MRFTAEQTSIPVPKVYCAFTYKGARYIVMSKIKGRAVSAEWCHLSEESKNNILNQLRQMIDELRSIEPTESTGVANVGNGPFFDCRLPSKLYWGPFPSIRHLHGELVDPIKIDVDYKETPPRFLELLNFYRQSFDKPVFTHGDLRSANIMMHEGQVTGIVDWETADGLHQATIFQLTERIGSYLITILAV